MPVETLKQLHETTRGDKDTNYAAMKKEGLFSPLILWQYWRDDYETMLNEGAIK